LDDSSIGDLHFQRQSTLRSEGDSRQRDQRYLEKLSDYNSYYRRPSFPEYRSDYQEQKQQGRQKQQDRLSNPSKMSTMNALPNQAFSCEIPVTDEYLEQLIHQYTSDPLTGQSTRFMRSKSKPTLELSKMRAPPITLFSKEPVNPIDLFDI